MLSTASAVAPRRRVAALVVFGALGLAALGAPGIGAAAPGRPADAARTAAPAQDGTAAGLKEEYDEALGQESELIAKVQAAQAEQAKLNAELDSLKQQVAAKEQELVAAQLEFQAAKDKAAARAEELERAEAEVARAEERLRQQLVASYVKGGEGSGVLEALLASTNSSDAGGALAYSKAVVGDTDELVDQLTEARAARRKADKAAKKAAKAATAKRDDAEAVTKFLAGARDNQQHLVDEINVQVWNEATALREVQGKKALIEGRINSLSTASDGIHMILADLQKDQPDWYPGSVRISHPLPGYDPGSAFGMRVHPILGITRLHAGDDIGAPMGTPIHAAADGTVVIAAVRGGYGNATVIDHGNSLATVYAHQSQILVKVGQVVKRGDVIGYVGSTGLSTGPHLHFETRVKGMPIDPKGVVDFDAPPDWDTTTTTAGN